MRGHGNVFSADDASALAAVTSDAMVHSFETRKLLDVGVQKFTRMVALVALDRLFGPRIAQSGQRSTQLTVALEPHLRGDM